MADRSGRSGGPGRAGWAGIAGWVAALLLLNFTLTFVNIWPTLRVWWDGGISGELAVLVLFLVATQWRRERISRRALTVLAILWVALVVGRYVDVTMRSLFGRSPSLYWDLQFVPDVSAMFAVVASVWWSVFVVVGLLAIPIVAFLIARWSLSRLAEATRHRVGGPLLSTLAVAVCALWIAQSSGSEVLTNVRVTEPAAVVYADQIREIAVETSGIGLVPLPDSPPMASDFSRVRGADVLLIFLESYGIASWERPEIAQGLVDVRARFEADVRDTGRSIASAFVESTTFGGESWLSHLSLLSGVEVRDERTTLRLMTENRDTLVKAFGRAGYRTVAVMPGLLSPWPEGAFYGYDEVYNHEWLNYGGPPFGWWDVNDQFALGRFDEVEIEPRDRRPVFMVLPTITTHAPFTPAPPYQPDWKRLLSANPYDDDEVNRAWEDQPDWTNLAPSYVKAMAYAYDMVGGYLRHRADRDLVVVLVGDHQPPALVSGEGAAWTVPVHVISSRPTLMERLASHEFVSGLRPAAKVVTRMDGLLTVLLDAFGDGGGEDAPR